MDAKGIRYCNSIDFDTSLLETCDILKRPRGNQGGRTKLRYLDMVTAFDIETTAISEIKQSFMYVWQWCFDGRITVIGRTWSEFINLAKEIIDICDSRDCGLVVYVHNLAYEFEFLSGIYDFTNDMIFAVDSRKVLKCIMGGHIEFRCSYLHTNMSLGQYLKKMGCSVQKESGKKFNYKKFRTSKTKLNDFEMDYILHDVVGLIEAIKKEMSMYEDNLYTIPPTSTGYVRRDIKAAMRQCPKGLIKSLLPDYNLYQLLREAFRGGDTHANRYFVGHILHNVKAFDRSSSYPGVLENRKYPMTPFKHNGRVEPEDMVKWLDGTYAILTRVSFKGLRLRDDFNGSPYITYSKCRAIAPKKEIMYDNGRVMSAEYVELTLTDIDLKIILHDYDFDDIQFYDCWYSKYDYLPEPLRAIIRYYYEQKTALKDVEGKEVEYNKFKNLFNAIYGLMAQDPVKQDILYDRDPDLVDKGLDGKIFMHASNDEREILKESNSKAFLPYQWGVWTTAHARYELRKGIWMADDHEHGNAIIYHDTDSVYSIDDVDWSSYNDPVIKMSTKNKAYAYDRKGNIHYMEVYEDDGVKKRFITWGAKKYAYETDDLHITIAGVNKIDGAIELAESGGLEALVPGYQFVKAGGMELTYNDHVKPFWYQHGKEKIYITKNVYMAESTYTLTLDKDYKKVLDLVANIVADNPDLVYNGYIGLKYKK